MIRYPFVFLLLSVGSVFFSFYDKKYEETLPITTGGIIVYLYITYIFNFLHIGYYILLGFIAILYMFCIYKFIKEKNKKKILNNIFTPGFFIFLGCYIIIFFIALGRRVLLWDELRLWGAYPKILYYDGSLQLGKAAKLLKDMQTYEPGMPLFQFFFSKSTNRFIEGDLFLAYGILGLVPFLSFTKKLSYKKWYYIPLFIVLFIILPLALANSHFDGMAYYYTLYIEPMLGIYFGYTMYLSLQNNQDKIDYSVYILSLCTLVLLKDTGIMFALTSIISYLLIHKKEWNKNNIKKLLLLLSCVLLFISWKGIQKIYTTDNLYSSRVKNNEIITFITGMNNDQKQIIKDFHKEALQKSFDSSFDQLERFINFYTTTLLIIIGLSYIIYKQKKKDKSKYIISSTCYLIGSLIFVLGTLALFIFSLHVVVCFQRYTSVVINAGILFIVMFLIDSVLNNEKNYTPLLIFTGLFLLLATPIKSPYMENFLYEATTKSDEYTDIIRNNITPKDKFMTVFGLSTLENLDGVIFHHHIYMNLLDENYGYIDNIILTEESDDLETDSVLVNKEISYQELLEKYDYIYFIVVNEEDKKQFSKTTNLEINESTLYKVINKERLEKVQ